jgi:CRP-like cAMP-binding protein
MLHMRGQIVPDIIFIEQGIASLTVDVFEGNGETEVGLIGREGIIGGTLLMEPDFRLPYKAFVQVHGYAYRIDKRAFIDLTNQMPAFRAACLSFINRLMAQTAQVAGCNVRHTIIERMARWILMTRDRTNEDEIPMTQEFLAVMLGARRAGISVAANALKSAGLIKVERGKITILDTEGLIAASCGCYSVMRDLYGNRR